MVIPKRPDDSEKPRAEIRSAPSDCGGDAKSLARRLALESAERRRLEEILRSLPHQILTAQETERRRIAAELHDSVIQLLGSIKFRLLHLEAKTSDATVSRTVAQSRELIEQAATEVRRISHNLRPSELEDLGLMPALRALLADFQARSKIPVDFKPGIHQIRFAPPIELAIYRIFQEALANIAQHSRARRATISLLADPNFVTLNIRDDGCGFASSEKRQPDKRGRGLGIISMRERAHAHGGVFAVKSSPGQGTEISVHLKIPS